MRFRTHRARSKSTPAFGRKPVVIDQATGVVYESQNGKTTFQAYNGTTQAAAIGDVIGRIQEVGQQEVVNLILWSEDISQSNYVVNATCTKTGTNQFNFPALNDWEYQQISISTVNGDKVTTQVVLSGTGTIDFLVDLPDGSLEAASTTVTLSATPTLYTVTVTATSSHSLARIVLIRRNANTATAVTCTKLQLNLGTFKGYQFTGASLGGLYPLYQPTGAARPQLGQLPKGGKINLAHSTEDITNWQTPSNLTLGASTFSVGGIILQSALETAVTDLHAQDYMDGVTFIAGLVYTVSYHVKPINGRHIVFSFPTGEFNGRWAGFNLTSKTVSTLDAGLAATITEELGAYRIAITGTCTVTTTGRCAYFVSNDATSISYAGDITKGIYVGGLKVEIGTLSSYVRVGNNIHYSQIQPALQVNRAYDPSNINGSATSKEGCTSSLATLSGISYPAAKLVNTGAYPSVAYQAIPVTHNQITQRYVSTKLKKDFIGAVNLNVFYIGGVSANPEDNVYFNLEAETVSGEPHTGEYTLEDCGDGFYIIGYRISVAAAADKTHLVVRLWIGPRADPTSNAGDVLYVAWVQLNDGSSRLPFQDFSGTWNTSSLAVPSIRMPYFGGSNYFATFGADQDINGCNFFFSSSRPHVIVIAFGAVPQNSSIILMEKHLGGAAATRNFQLYMNSSGYLVLNVRGEVNNLTSKLAGDGKLHLLLISWDGVSGYTKIDTLAPVALTVGTAAQEVVNMIFGTSWVGFAELCTAKPLKLSLLQLEQMAHMYCQKYGIE